MENEKINKIIINISIDNYIYGYLSKNYTHFHLRKFIKTRKYGIEIYKIKKLTTNI